MNTNIVWAMICIEIYWSIEYMLQLPFVMDFVLNLTYRCNLRCEMCTQYGANFKENAGEDLDINVWLKFLAEIKDIEPKPNLILMGGEPFLYKDFDTLFLTACKYGIKTHIITNGFYLDKYLPILKDTDTCITISIDGLFDIHDKIRGLKGLFKKVINNINEIDKLQKQGSKIKLKINHVLLPDNAEEIVNFHEYFKKYNIETYTFQHLQFSSDELNKISLNEWRERVNGNYSSGLIPQRKYLIEEEYVEKIRNSLNQFRQYNTDDNCFAFPSLEDEELADYYMNNNLDKLRQNRICTTPWINPIIHPNGDVSNCIENTIGNIKENGFWEIWNSQKAQQFRNCLVNDGKFTLCTKCCNFYKGNFIAAKDGKIDINGKKLQLPGDLNFVHYSKKIAFVKDDEEKTGDYIPVIPINIYNERVLQEIENENEIITIMD